MGERKVLNKYFPIDFDPSKVPKRVKGLVKSDGQNKVRMMVPMTLRCSNCGNFIYKGTKFNSRKETVQGEDYLGIKIFRFYMRCSRCSQELTIKTDPKNADYVAELGCTRNFEIWKEKDKDVSDAREIRAEEEKGDAMKKLENRTLDSKMEMEILDALEEVQHMNARNNLVGTDELLTAVEEKHKAKDELARLEAEEAKMAELRDEEFEGADGIDVDDLQGLKTMSSSDQYIRRVAADSFKDDDDPYLRLQKRMAAHQATTQTSGSDFKAPMARLPTKPQATSSEPSKVVFNPFAKSQAAAAPAPKPNKPKFIVASTEEGDSSSSGGGGLLSLVGYGTGEN